MQGYYDQSLGGERLRRCYELASARVRQYLAAEIGFVLDRVRPQDSVLELGCGYGRVALRLAGAAGRVVGIDTAAASIALARELARDLDPEGPPCEFLQMNAVELDFPAEQFDLVVCIQNGICAFGVDQRELLREALRVARPRGRLLFSSYSAGFWPERLGWFEAQAAAGLVGAIDRQRTGGNTIVCTDGFQVSIMTPEGFRELAAGLGLPAQLTEVDGSSVFCEIIAP